MKLQTAFDIGDELHFHPLNENTLEKGRVISIYVAVSKDLSLTINYDLIVANTEGVDGVWGVSEEDAEFVGE